MDFFVQQVSEYYAEGGKQIPTEVLAVLGKQSSVLNAEEVAIYNRFIGPFQDKIRNALIYRYREKGSPYDEWAARIRPYQRPMIEELAAQALGMEQVVPLPQAFALPAAPESAYPYEQKTIRDRVVPILTSKWTIVSAVTVVVLITAVFAVWFYFSATAPSRLLNKAKGELERGEYVAAIEHFEEVEREYSDTEQAAEAADLKADAALAYAEQLRAAGEYQEAIKLYGLAQNKEAHVGQAMHGQTEAYLGWAGTLSEGAEYGDAFDCYEAALECAPEGYDRNPVMERRADLLFRWGEQLCSESNYAAAALRFEKCYTEWPAGPLAGNANTNYVDMMVASFSQQPPPSKAASAGGQVELRLHNTHDGSIRYFLSGPSTMYLDLGPDARQTIYILPGFYNDLVYSSDPTCMPGGKTNIDFSQPASGNTWWETELWFEETAETAQTVEFAVILGRIEQLESTLPPELSGCFEELEYMELTEEFTPADLGGLYDAEEEVVFFIPSTISPEELDAAIFHEWGRVFSDNYLDGDEKEEYMRLRNILPGTDWENYANMMQSVEEDFAEVFGVVFGSTQWRNYTAFGAVTNADAIREMILGTID